MSFENEFRDVVYRIRVLEAAGLVLVSWEDEHKHLIFATSSAPTFSEALDRSLEQLKENILYKASGED